MEWPHFLALIFVGLRLTAATGMATFGIELKPPDDLGGWFGDQIHYIHQ